VLDIFALYRVLDLFALYSVLDLFEQDTAATMVTVKFRQHSTKHLKRLA